LTTLMASHTWCCTTRHRSTPTSWWGHPRCDGQETATLVLACTTFCFRLGLAGANGQSPTCPSHSSITWAADVSYCAQLLKWTESIQLSPTGMQYSYCGRKRTVKNVLNLLTKQPIVLFFSTIMGFMYSISVRFSELGCLRQGRTAGDNPVMRGWRGRWDGKEGIYHRWRHRLRLSATGHVANVSQFVHDIHWRHCAGVECRHHAKEVGSWCATNIMSPSAEINSG
jgi:hypothetical protein